jgi:PPOX class probable FMN-dependent enzyme
VYKAEHVVRTKEEIQAMLGEVSENQANKRIDHLDQHCRTWIERTPFIVISTSSLAGYMDVSPKGDPPGFVKVLDEHTLAIPDRPGNRRADTFLNILENPKIGLLFVIPRRGETLRVSGTAEIIKDQGVLSTMAIRDKVPTLAILVHIEGAMFHCGKSMIRSSMWNPDGWPSIEGLPTYAKALVDHARPPQTEEEMQERITRNEVERLY